MDTFATPLQPLKDVHSSKALIKVFVRARPLLSKEISDGADNILSFSAHEKQVLVEDGSKGRFVYDGVCDESSSQEDVFQLIVTPLLKHVQEGHNVTVMAYGQTGSGKTYTMGTNPALSKESYGMLQRVIEALLNLQENKDDKENEENCNNNNQFLQMSFLEVYNESVYDLLNNRKTVTTKSDGFGGVIPMDCTEERICSLDEGLDLMERGNGLRKVAATVMNAHSSRSHALISLTLGQKKDDGSTLKGCLRLVDLAGAEGVGRNKMEGRGFCEGVNINKGLLAIGKVLAALSSHNSLSHIPYRESMITRLLRDALGGNSYTALITCVSPASINLTVTLNTLRYAEQARNIRNKPTGFSTIKRKGVKRGLEDVSATPQAWKKYVSGKEKSDHNATISTPGHKPPVRRVPSLSSSFVTPFQKPSDLRGKWPRSSSRTDLTSCIDLPLRPPAFEEDEEDDVISAAPSIITAPPANSTFFQISPLAERVNSRLEQSILGVMESQMKDLEERLANKVVKMLTKGTQSRRQSRRLQAKKESTFLNKMSTPGKGNFSDSNHDDEERFSLADSIAEALLQKNAFRNVLKDVMVKAETNDHLQNSLSQSKVDTWKHSDRKPFHDVTNLDETGMNDDTVIYRGTSDSNTSSHPVTSTVAPPPGKIVRRSSRMSSRFALPTPIPCRLNAPSTPGSAGQDRRGRDKGEVHESIGSASSFMSGIFAKGMLLKVMKHAKHLNFFCKMDETVVYQPDVEASQATLTACGVPTSSRRSLRLQQPQNPSDGANTTALLSYTQLQPADKRRLSAEKRRLSAEKRRLSAEKHRLPAEKHRLSAEKHRLSAEKQRFSAEKHRLTKSPANLSSKISPTVVGRPVESLNISTRVKDPTRRTRNLSYSYLGNIPFTSDTETNLVPPKGERRRSTRKASLVASAKNFDIFNKVESPLGSIPQNRSQKRKSSSKAVIKPSANNTVTGEKWRLVISPTLQKEHSQGILKILNTASLRDLQKLPTIGPKTAMVIYNFRRMYGKLNCVEDLQNVPGLPKSYYSRFMKANLMNQIDFK